jgi:hypothetical protein
LTCLSLSSISTETTRVVMMSRISILVPFTSAKHS